MSKVNLLAEARNLQKEADKAWAKVKRNQERAAKYWYGKFVNVYTKDNEVHSDILERGLKELESYGLYYDPKRKDLWNDDGISYNPKHYSCGICDGLPHNDISIGFAPRYAVCAKHEDFLMLTPNIFRKDKK